MLVFAGGFVSSEHATGRRYQGVNDRVFHGSYNVRERLSLLIGLTATMAQLW